MIKIEIPKDKDKIKMQIQALEWQNSNDKTEKDREVHLEALKTLKMALNSRVKYEIEEETIKTNTDTEIENLYKVTPQVKK